jgi:carbon-monoxide dehydrogenase large subunit
MDASINHASEAWVRSVSAAIVHAVIDTLKALGVRHLDMPLTSEKVWRAIRAARVTAA